MISKTAKDLLNNEAANAALVGGSGLALAGSSDAVRNAYLRTVNPASAGGRAMSLLGANTLGALGSSAWQAAYMPVASKLQAEGKLSENTLRAMADVLNAPADLEFVKSPNYDEFVKLKGFGPLAGNFAMWGDAKRDIKPMVQHTASSIAAHEIGHVTSPIAKVVGGTPLLVAHNIGMKSTQSLPQLAALLAASQDYDARHGLKSSKATKLLKAMTAASYLSAMPMLAEEAQASIRGYKPVNKVLGSAEARRYAGKAGLAYLSYLAPVLQALALSPHIGKAGGRIASRFMPSA